ncbi:hypothetical protein [Roseiarcus sp.]|uniref:hypothetical protein n=1 Tax=Roseiarcus sp. TaxID=1969460 RepID=UPI003F957785
MVTKPTGRPSGRPPGSVKDHKDRYVLAFFDAWITIKKEQGFKELAVLKSLMGAAVGAPDPTSDNLARMARGLPFRVLTPGEPRLGKQWETVSRIEDERHRNSFAPYVDDLRRTLRILRKRNDERGVWHRQLSRVWRLVIESVIESDAAKVDKARALADGMSEAAFFENELLPGIIADPTTWFALWKDRRA